MHIYKRVLQYHINPRYRKWSLEIFILKFSVVALRVKISVLERKRGVGFF
ncbi:hypothetical protein BofuT4_uP152850.1 [Botrytis cinerea T4]|uniref:Uncharacterized protein n=1 Tax=Botryotinia fuckeliana (strain T4) TaxID=999810 RepID=G2YVS5_BOTF4|nr:hypothetical protein BofuT4_uP152850.1 [Botrytis cinerea T4]